MSAVVVKIVFWKILFGFIKKKLMECKRVGIPSSFLSACVMYLEKRKQICTENRPAVHQY